MAKRLSPGQVVAAPVQVSAASQGPAAARHTVPAGCFASAGQLVDVPVHVSVASHTSTETRHTVPALPALWTHAIAGPAVVLNKFVEGMMAYAMEGPVQRRRATAPPPFW